MASVWRTKIAPCLPSVTLPHTLFIFVWLVYFLPHLQLQSCIHTSLQTGFTMTNQVDNSNKETEQCRKIVCLLFPFFNKYVEHYNQDNTKFRFRFFFNECLHLHSLFTDLCTKTISYSRFESVKLNYTTPSPRSTNK